MAGADQHELLLVPYTRAIELLNGRDITLTILTPPYPALGCGVLHVVRATEEGNAVHLEATYDDYERLP
ncbi:MAG: hypothetical protein M3Z41_05875 [Candidatus Eremiobacteraeota bacterium]|nr:hypothetical protein [Candidatus Eremiobacteraeota bacterium]